MRAAHRTKKRKNVPSRTYGYYLCPSRHDHGENGYSIRRSLSAMALEAKAWRFVRSVMTNPEELTRDLDRMIELRREGERGGPGAQAHAWLEEIAKVERLRDGYHDQAAEGLLGLDKLREKLAALDERRAVAEQELKVLEDRQEELERLESDREAVVEHYAALVPEVLEALGPEERGRLYGILGLKVSVTADGEAWAEMPIRPPTRLEEQRSVYRKGFTPTCAPAGGPS